MTKSFDTLAPSRTVVVKSRSKPWISPNIRALIKQRDSAYKYAERTGLATDFCRFRFLRSRVSNLIDSSKNLHLKQWIENAPSAVAKWTEFRKLRLSRSTFSSPLNFFTKTALNTHYAEVSRVHPAMTHEDLMQVLSLNLNSSRPTFKFAPVSIETVRRAIISGSSKVTGSDNVSVEMLKSSQSAFLLPLTELINRCILSDSFPELWKYILIRPLSKIASPLSLSDTRPIASLSEISKVFERIIHQQLIAYLETNNLLDERQAGYRAGHGTQAGLLTVLEDIRIGIDKELITMLVLLDFSKAFDSIPHQVLLRKMREFNCESSALKLIFNYLSNRLQAVIDNNGNVSDWIETTTGVPQGSILGPLLFLIFINDLPQVLKTCRYVLYADDLQIYFSFHIDDILEVIARINIDIEYIEQWCIRNGLRLNPSKTKAIICGCRNFISRLDLATLPRIMVGGISIDYSDEIND